MPSVRKIAKDMRVSVATVSRALNNHPEVSAGTREKILRAANEVGYFGSVGKRVMTNIGLVYTSDVEFCEYDATLMGGIVRGVGEQRFDVTVLNLERDKGDDETYTQFFMRKGVRGAIVRTLARSRHICEAIADEGFPHVVVAERFENANVNFVCYDSQHDSRRAVEHLISMGHRRIALAVHAIPDSDHAARIDGYHDAMRAAGLEIDPELLLSVMAGMESGRSTINRLMSVKNPPTAIYFTDPLTCVGALQRAHAMGLKIPDDLSIVGFDDSNVRFQTWPVLSAVCQDAARLGFEAALWLTRKLAGVHDEPMRKAMSTFFEVHETTGLPPARPVRVLPNGQRVDGGEKRNLATDGAPMSTDEMQQKKS
jgi:DNA-binding LacI/PurR family transcriptional regulator